MFILFCYKDGEVTGDMKNFSVNYIFFGENDRYISETCLRVSLSARVCVCERFFLVRSRRRLQKFQSEDREFVRLLKEVRYHKCLTWAWMNC